ncbi:uncharacterized protein B0H18DRAFT_960667 [Fomitopsis serialis]|uniref:uncharacterized protein n=1 Tax=Fomitopsis serialis TaxID=139415 RepID=UPI002007D89C|nr:uncharacterized protein B0H18DRAFT_960667 [Neoantrodia serialis]KAH9913019.1 hypothetical protein B0H18DRAFT_960667 [Neoantrodia serialis]
MNGESTIGAISHWAMTQGCLINEAQMALWTLKDEPVAPTLSGSGGSASKKEVRRRSEEEGIPSSHDIQTHWRFRYMTVPDYCCASPQGLTCQDVSRRQIGGVHTLVSVERCRKTMTGSAMTAGVTFALCRILYAYAGTNDLQPIYTRSDGRDGISYWQVRNRTLGMSGPRFLR